MPLEWRVPGRDAKTVIIEQGFFMCKKIRQSSIARSVTSGLLLTTLGLIASPSARADQGLIPYATATPRELESDAFTFGIFQVERYDSNFFRLPDDVAPADGRRRSGISSISGAGLSFDKAYGLQRVTINAAASRSLYTPRGNLDENAGRFDAKLAWSITPQLTGDLIFNYLRLPTDYADTNATSKTNPRTSHLTEGDVDFRPGAALHPRFTIRQEESRTQDPTFQVQSSRSTTLEGSLVYEFASTNSIGLFVNRSRGQNLGIPDNPALQQSQSFNESEYGVRVNWKSEGRWDVASYIAHHIRDGQTYSARNFSGTVGDLNVAYALTGRTKVEFDINRHLYSSADLFGSYFEASEARIGLAYDLSGKLVLRPQYDIIRQRYNGSPFPTDNLLVEKTQFATLRLDYAALRSLDVAALLSLSRRTSNLSSLQYKNKSASVFARFKF